MNIRMVHVLCMQVCSFACVDTAWMSLTETTWSHPPVLVRSSWMMRSGAVDAGFSCVKYMHHVRCREELGWPEIR